MHEVFRAMSSLNFEWKVINPFHVRVQRKNPVLGNFVSKCILHAQLLHLVFCYNHILY